MTESGASRVRLRSFPSLPQKDHHGRRTEEENDLFIRCLSGMGGLYASISCTSVLQLTAQPSEQPAEFRGLVKLFNFPVSSLADGTSDKVLPPELHLYLDGLSEVADALITAALREDPKWKHAADSTGPRRTVMRHKEKMSTSVHAAAPTDLLVRVRQMQAGMGARECAPLRPEGGKLDFHANLLCFEVSASECVLRLASFELAQLLLWTVEVLALRRFLDYCRVAERWESHLSPELRDRSSVESWLLETCTRKDLRALASKAAFPAQPPAHNTTPLEWVRLKAGPQALARLQSDGVRLPNSELEQALLEPERSVGDVVKFDAEKWDGFRVSHDLKEEIYVQCSPEPKAAAEAQNGAVVAPADARPPPPVFFQPKDVDEARATPTYAQGCDGWLAAVAAGAP